MVALSREGHRAATPLHFLASNCRTAIVNHGHPVGRYETANSSINMDLSRVCTNQARAWLLTWNLFPPVAASFPMIMAEDGTVAPNVAPPTVAGPVPGCRRQVHTVETCDGHRAVLDAVQRTCQSAQHRR